jgi:hypothetical protein
MTNKPQLNGKIPFWIITVIIFTVWFRIGWVLFYPYEPAKIHGKITVFPEIVQAGGVINYTVDYEKFMNVPAIVTKMIANNRVFHFAPVTQHFPEGRRIFSKPLDVPPEAHGIARIYFAIEYPVSSLPIRKVIVGRWSEPFEVVPLPSVKGLKGDTGKQGIQGKTGPAGEGLTIFGGKPGPEGEQGKPGKSCVGTDCK